MNEQQGREYLADVLGVPLPVIAAALRGLQWQEARRVDPALLEQQTAVLEQYEQQRRVSLAWWRQHSTRGHQADRVIVDDAVGWDPSDHGTGWALDVSDSPAARDWYRELVSTPPVGRELPPDLLPDRIRYAPEVEHDRHGRSVAGWAARQVRDRGRRVPVAQQDRLTKFLDDWTRP